MKTLEYIELDGRSFISTKLSPDDPGLALEFWVKPGQSPWGDGGMAGNGQYAFFAGAEQGSDIWGIKTAVLMEEFVGENCGTYTNGITYYSPEWYHIVVENGELSVYQVDEFNGSEYLVGQELFDPSSVSLPNVFIGTLNKEDTDFYDAPCCGVLFGKIIVNGDELLPAEDDEGRHTSEPGTIGWFDETNGVFYENGGDGSFIAGPYVSTGLEFSPASLSVGSAQTTQAISVTNPDGHFYSVASAPNWVYATALPPYDLSVTINENASGNTARSGDIQVEDTDDGTYYTIPVSQSAGAPIPVPPISITPSAATIGYSGGVITAQVTCGHNWGVSWDDRYGEFYVLNNNNNISIFVLPNLSPSAATHSIVFTDKTTSESATMTITQDAYPSGSTYPFYLGSSAITKAYVGDEEISAAYLGDTLVFGTGGPSGPVVPVEYITSVSGGDGFVINHTINTGVIDHQMHTDIYYEGLGYCDRIICYMYGDPGVESTYAASRICTTSGGVIVDYAMNRGSFGDRTFALGDHSLRFTDGNVFDIENEQWLYQTGGGTILSGNTILADVSMTKIKKLVIGGVLDSSNAESVLYFVGYAAKSGNTYGIYDMVSRRFITSNVELTDDRPSPEPPTPSYDEMPLTFEILSAGTIVWKATSNTAYKTIEYSLNDGAWTTITSNTGSSAPSINVAIGDKIQFRGDNNTYGINYSNDSSFDGSTAYFNAYGNILSLINSTGFTGVTSLSGQYVFKRLFKYTNVCDASNIVIPTTNIPAYGLYETFIGCTNLVKAPDLPATSLASNCYYGMFYNCNNLIDGPSSLPALITYANCYDKMFYNCYRLENAPEILCSSINIRSCREMFYGCSLLDYIKCLATNVSQTDCTLNWLNGVSAIGTFVKDPNMTSWPTGTSGIPSGWQVVDNA